MERFLFGKFDTGSSFWSIFILSILISVAFQGSRGLYESTEGRYAECAREMLLSGNFLEPALDYQPHWSKPPLTYWAIAAGMALLGQNEWGVRAYLVVAFCLTMAAIYLMAGRVWGKEAAPYCAIVYTTSFFSAAAANIVSPDMLLTLWEALAIWGFWSGIRSSKKTYFILMWLFLSAGFITKGPPALIPLLSILPIHGLMRHKKWNIPPIFPISGVLLFIIVGLGWYIFEVWLHPGLFLQWIKHEIPGHLFTNEFARNTKWYKAILIYWPVLILGSLPWTGILLWKWRHLPWPRRRWFHADYWSNNIEWSFVVLSIFLPLLIFSLSKSKLPLYVLPLFLPFSLALGKGLHFLTLNQKVKLSIVKRITFFALIVIIAGKGIASNIHSTKDMRQLAGKITPVIAHFPRSHFYFVGDSSLYGLEFYLNRLFIRVSQMEPAPQSTMSLSIFSEALSTDLASGIVPFILVRNEDIPKLQGIFPPTGSQSQIEKGEKKIKRTGFEEYLYQKRKPNDLWVLISWKGKDSSLFYLTDR
jgi:4-amino-4-deoxy-L-arabinose transferase